MSASPNPFPDDAEPGAAQPEIPDGSKPEAITEHTSQEPEVVPLLLPDEVVPLPPAEPGETVEASRPILPSPEIPLFARYEYVPVRRPTPQRIPNFGHLLVFLLLLVGGYLCSGLVIFAALHEHLFGISTFKQAEDEIHYRLGSQAVWYLITLFFCLWVFPLLWQKSFFAGLEWRGFAAFRQRWRLFGAALACFGVAIVDEILIPGPTNTPIDQTFRLPGAVWMLFAFGVTLAPLIEEIAYRGFLLPALCTAYDWFMERATGSLAPQADPAGRPRWSTPAMIVASIVCSIPFALMHGDQTAYSLGPFLLLVGVSLVLCWVRLGMHSLAASVMVHSSYNLLLFTLMFLGTGGFRHLERM